MGKKEEAVALWEEIGNETQIGMNSATRLRTAALRILEALDEVSAQSDDTKADKDSFETFTCGRFIVKTDNTGNELEIFNRDDEKIMFRVRNGQVFSYGRTNVAHGAFNAYTNNGEIRYEINTLNGNIYLKLHNDLNENTLLLDSNGISKLLGLDVQHERVRNVGQATADYDAVNLYQLSQLLLIDASGFNKNLPQTVTSLQLLSNAVDQLESNGGLANVNHDSTLTGNGNDIPLSVVGNPMARFSTSESTVTDNTTKVLTVDSKYNQIFTGTNSHGVKMPVASTLTIGYSFNIINSSTQTIIAMSSGGNIIVNIAPQQTSIITCILLTGTDALSWSFILNQNIPTISSGEKILSETSSGVQANYDAIEMIVPVGVIGSADWSSGSITSTGLQGQVAYDSGYRYDCVSLNTWRRTTLNYDTVNLYLGTIDDTTSKTSSDLQTAFPSSLIGQKVRGINFMYEKYDMTLWHKTPITYI